MKRHITTLSLILLFLIGLSLLLYPTLSDYWNSMHQSKAIAVYAEEVAKLEGGEYDVLWAAASDYNSALLTRPNSFVLTGDQKEKYESLLNIGGNGVMGYIEIPSVSCILPIYHGTDEAVLQVAVGHLEWTSLPVGGGSSHCVLSGHRGLPSAKLFTNLDKLAEGDTFILRVLDETMTYEVDQILIVEPDDTSALMIEEGQDLCTLVTCTPYGVSSHRLLVRGHRVENREEAVAVRVTADAMQIEPLIVAPILTVPILIVLGVIVFAGGGKKKE